MITEINQDQFKELIKTGFHIVDFYGTHCGPCKLLAKTLEGLDVDYPFLSILKLNVDNNSDLAVEMRVMSVPTIFFYKDGELLARKAGALGADDILEIAAPNLY